MSKYFDGTGTIGFTCDNCGRETQGCILVNGMNFCAKCYQEIFGGSIDWQLLDKEKTIADLQTQLSLTEKALEFACERVKYFEEMQDKEMGFYEFFGYDSGYDLKAIIEQYKEQAKEIMKNE